MLEILKLVSDNFGAFFIVGIGLYLGAILIEVFINITFKIFNRFMRMLMVRKHGWPPSHLDADGDFKIENKE